MRLLRRFANHLVEKNVPVLRSADRQQIERAFRYVGWIPRSLGVPLPFGVDGNILRDYALMFGEALLETPYGEPLHFSEPLIITVSVSDYCPFACSNCYSNSIRSSKDRSPFKNERIFRDIAASRTPFIFITGGEPLAFRECYDRVQMLLERGKWVYLSTNASIGRHIELLARYPSSYHLVLPIWGRRERHNERRGAQSFERVERNLELLSANGAQGTLLVVLADNDLSVFDDVEELADRYRISGVRINRKVDVGRMDEARAEVSSEFADELASRVKRLKTKVGLVLNEVPELRASNARSAVPSYLGIGSYQGCAAGHWMMHIDDAGAAYPCFTFETHVAASAAAGQSVAEQWSLVRKHRRDLGDGDVCVGEAQAMRAGG